MEEGNFNEEDNTACLELFDNVGDNSWIDNNHYFALCHNNVCFGSWLDSLNENFSETFFNEDFFGDLNINKQEVIDYLLKERKIREDDIKEFKFDYNSILNYIKSHDNCMNAAYKIYCESVEENYDALADNAERVISEWKKDFDEKRKEFCYE